MNTSPTLGLRAALASALLLHGLHAAGQPAKEDESALFAPIPSVVTASKFGQSIEEAPASISTVTAREIARFGYRTLGDILDNVRGFALSGDRNYSYLGLRGFARTGDYNSRFLLLLDGRRINDNLYGDVGLGHEGIVDVQMIDRIEVVRGPSSSLYGASAFLGVVNVITKRGRDLDGGVAAISAGNERGRALRGAWGRQFDAGHEVIVSASTYSSKGDPRLYYGAFDAPGTNFGVAENADGERAHRLFGKLRLGHFELEGALVQREKHVPTASFGTVFNDNRTLTRDRRAFIEARHEAELSPSTTVRSRFSWNTSSFDGDYVYDRGAGPYVNKDYSRGEWWTGEVTGTTRLGTAHKLTYGAEFQRDRRLEQGNYDTMVFLDDRRTGRNSALYVQDEWRFGRAILNAGLRFDRYSTFGSASSPRLALIVPVVQGTTLKLLGGNAFRVPNAYELYYTDGNATQMANPALRPEKIRTRELVVEQRLPKGWRGSVSVFDYAIADLIRQVTDPGTGLLVFRNLAQVTASGLSVEAGGRLWERIDLNANLTMQRSRDEQTGADLVNSPRRIGKLQLGVPFMDERVQAGVAARYLSPRQTQGGNQIGTSVLFDLTLRARLGASGTTLAFSAYNLFNRPYADPGAREHVQDTIPQARRTLWLTLEQKL